MPSILKKVQSSATGIGDSLRASALANPQALREVLKGRAGASSLDRSVLRLRLDEALGWLCRAQDQGGDRGFARGYSVAWNPHFRLRGWQPSYPETTGYIIPTFFLAAKRLGRAEMAERAVAAADWEIDVQLPSGAVRGGMMGQQPSPSTFNTGQVLFGWLAAFKETGESRFEEALRRAGDFLCAAQGPDGEWQAADSRYAREGSTLYNARTAWGLAEVGVALGVEQYREGAARYLRRVVEAQHANGWLPRCCLYDPHHPLLHTLAYTYRGLLEAGRLLDDAEVSAAGRLGAEALLGALAENGRMVGRFGEDWSGAVGWSCLTGQAQMANIWLRLAELTGEESWIEPAERSLAFVASTQRLTGPEGIRGGIWGSDPVDGPYGRFEILNWATKFFADGLIRLDFSRERDTEARETIPGHLRSLP